MTKKTSFGNTGAFKILSRAEQDSPGWWQENRCGCRYWNIGQQRLIAKSRHTVGEGYNCEWYLLNESSVLDIDRDCALIILKGLTL